MKIGIIGCGFWAGYQVAAWREADPSLEFTFCDRTEARASAMATRFGASEWFTDASTMLKSESLDAVDIITTPETHASLTKLVASHGIPVICQKPMAPVLAEAEEMVAVCNQLQVPFYVHENFRWQIPLRHLKQLLDQGRIGAPFRARLYFNSGFPIFENQPNLAELDQFILSDLGVHVLDVCRFLFGEVKRLFCLNQRVNPNIKGEDVCTILLEMESGLTCTVEVSYASIVDYECFPQTLAEVEGNRGFVRVSPDYKFTTTTSNGQDEQLLIVPNYDWVHPEYAVVHTSMVAIHQNFLEGLRDGKPVETTGEDNLRTLQLTYAAYDSAEKGEAVEMAKFLVK